MSTSSSVRSLLFTFLGLALIAGCANNRGVKGGSGSGGDLYDNGSVPIGDNPLPERDGEGPESYNWETLAPYTVYFGFDSFTIDPQERAKLEKAADYLKEHSNVKVFLAGHTDARGTTQYNLALGERRAISAREYLIGLGVPAGRLQTVSYGEEQPADSGEGDAAYAKNRRVQIGVK